jgi:carbon-monoxide dehydrogenase medium subunit
MPKEENMKNFEYLAPKSLEEAITLISQYDGRAKIMAGGTDLLVEMRKGELQPDVLIDLKCIPDLDTMDSDNEGLGIGALTRIGDIETSRIIQEKFNVLSQGAATLGSVQVRNKATVGGNLCHAAPSADMAPALIGLGALAKWVGPEGDRTLPLEEFFLGPGETCLRTDQILTELSVPNMASFSEAVYLKFSPRGAMDLAVVGVASVLTMDSSMTHCSDIRIVLGAVAPTPIRATRAEATLRGNKLSDVLVNEAARVASEEAKPITDIRASEWFRRQIVEVLVRRSINRAAAKLKAGGK